MRPTYMLLFSPNKIWNNLICKISSHTFHQIGFRNLNFLDGGWSTNPTWTVFCNQYFWIFNILDLQKIFKELSLLFSSTSFLDDFSTFGRSGRSVPLVNHTPSSSPFLLRRQQQPARVTSAVNEEANNNINRNSPMAFVRAATINKNRCSSKIRIIATTYLLYLPIEGASTCEEIRSELIYEIKRSERNSEW